MITPQGIGLIEWVATGGTANNVVTDGVVYPVGTTIINLAAGGTGSLSVGQRIRFEGDDMYYTLATGFQDVTVGGTITLRQPLQKAITAAVRVWSGHELKRGWGHLSWQQPSGYLTGNTPLAYGEWYEAGDLCQLFLDYKYGVLDVNKKYNHIQSVSTAGLVATTVNGGEESFRISQRFVDDLRSATTVSDAQAFESFIDRAIKGVPFLWFLDYENFPDEYMVCTMERRAEAVRDGTIGKFSYTMHLRALPMQI